MVSMLLTGITDSSLMSAKNATLEISTSSTRFTQILQSIFVVFFYYFNIYIRSF